MKGTFLAIMLPLLWLTGCGTVVDAVVKTGRVLYDPSIQVGADDDQPTQVALSLYAQPDVNPNGRHEVDTERGFDKARDVAVVKTDGPYTISLTSNNKSELITNLHHLLVSLQDGADSPAVPSSAQLSLEPEHDVIDTMTLLAPLPEAVGDGKHASPPALDHVEVPDHVEAPDHIEASDHIKAPDHADKGVVADDSNGGLPLGVGDELGQYRANGNRQSFHAASTHTGAVASVGTPIAFKVLQLTDDSLLLNADPSQLRKNLKKTLGSTYVSADDYLLLPGQFKYVNFNAIDEDTRYLAVIADFHDNNADAWKQAIRVEPKGRKYSLLITLGGTRVRIVDEQMPTPVPSKPLATTCTPERPTSNALVPRSTISLSQPTL